MPQRSYRQYCALARALDAVGDRWSMLVVRNLILGPRRWTEMRQDLPGIAKNLLSSRLSDLIAASIIDRDADDHYRLTACGAELEPVLFALADWGERHAFGPPREGEAMRLRYLMTSIRRRLRPTQRQQWLQLHVGDDPYAVGLGPKPTVEQGSQPTPHVLVCEVGGLQGLLVARRPPATLVEAGAIRIEGDLGVVTAFVDALPPFGT